VLSKAWPFFLVVLVSIALLTFVARKRMRDHAARTREREAAIMESMTALAAAAKAKPATSTLAAAANKPSADPNQQANRQVLAEHRIFLMKRRLRAKEELRAEALRTVPSWYFDPPTHAQRRRLEAAGLALPSQASRGYASDMLGLLEPADARDLEVLEFFSSQRPSASYTTNLSMARDRAARLLADPARLASWQERPADLLQAEGLRRFNLQATTAREAEQQLAAARESAPAPTWRAWEAFERAYSQIRDFDTRVEFGIVKPAPTIAAARLAFDAARMAGHAPQSIDAAVLSSQLR
jgi:hypothetical protein